MKVNFGGLDVEMTVQEFVEFIKAFEVQKSPTDELNSLKHWGVHELEFNVDGSAKATLIQTPDLNKYGNKMSHIEAMGRFWKAKLGEEN